MRKQVNFAEAVGKTVERVEWQYGDVWVMFTDGTFSNLRGTRDYDSDVYIHEPTFELGSHWGESDLEYLCEIGVITDEESRARWRQIEGEKVRRAAEAAERERREYERLRAKFEPENQP